MEKKAFIESIKPINKIFQFCGFLPYYLGRTSSTNKCIFTIIYSLILIIYFLVTFSIVLPTTKKDFGEMKRISHYVTFGDYIAYTIVHLFLTVDSFLKAKLYKKILKKIELIDSLLKFKLNCKINYNYFIKNCFIYLFFTNFILIVIFLITLYYSIESHYTFYLIAISIPKPILYLKTFQFVFFVIIVNQRVYNLNNKISHLVIIRKSSVLKDLKLIEKIRTEIFVLSCWINNYFGLTLLLIFIQFFFGVITNGYWLFLGLSNISNATVGDSVCFAIPPLLMLFIMTYYCEHCMKDTSQTPALLHKIQRPRSKVLFEFNLKVE